MRDARQAPRTPIRTRPWPGDGCRALSAARISIRDTEAFLARLPVAERIACGSALKFCLVAEGAADVYPRLAPTSEWDVAAGHAIVAAAGGVVTRAGRDAAVLRPRPQGFRVPAFIAWGDPAARGDAPLRSVANSRLERAEHVRPLAARPSAMTRSRSAAKAAARVGVKNR